jgi:hypothetical protein
MRCIIGFLFFIIILLPGNAQETFILKFDELFALNGSAKFNFLNYSHGDDAFRSNRPLDLGIGFRYRDFSFSFSVNIPFIYDKKYPISESLDFGITYFYENSFYFDSYVKYYNGFYSELETINNKEIDTRIFFSGISGEYIFNKDHSLRSVYNLDRRQTKSNGSFIIGGGIFFTSVNYPEGGKTIQFGPNFGYSYNWIIKNDFFVNGIMILGLNGAVTDKNLNYNFQVLPKLAFGYHSKTWSINICCINFALLYPESYDNEYNVLSSSVSLNVSKRF